MLRLTRFINQTLSARISLMVVFAIAVLLTAALFIMFRYSRKTVKDEAIQKARYTLETTVQQIDNILFSVEQSTGNFYFDILNHLDDPERMYLYSRKVVETNPYIAGCAIAFEPSYYKKGEQYFMTYSRRADSGEMANSKAPIIQATTYGNKPYTEQAWYTRPHEIGSPCWLDPKENVNGEDEAIITFSIPLYDGQRHAVGVLAADVSLELLSKIIQAAKPSPNSNATLLGSDGSYIVHPDRTKLFHQKVNTQESKSADPMIIRAAKAMMAGETGFKSFQLNGTDCYIFYKPFIRSNVPGRAEQQLDWSVGIVYPEEDIFGDYNELLYLVLTIAIIGLLLLTVLCQWITHRQLLPLKTLTKSAQRIADGHYDEPIPDSRQQDEVGQLQDHFQQMQQALATHVSKLEQLTTTLNERGKVLARAYEQAKEADRVKTAFLHNMTNQMVVPVGAICDDVSNLSTHAHDMEQQESDRLADDIQRQSKTVTDLLNELLEISQNESSLKQ